MAKKSLRPQKARQMLRDNSAQGHPLTPKQRGYFGLIASGAEPTRSASSALRALKGK
jgi:hypothetical protein